jgi:hypothetical protein
VRTQVPCRFPLHGVRDEHEPKVPLTTGNTPASGRMAHTWSLLAVPGAWTKVPAAHVVHAVQEVALVVEKVPGAHALQDNALVVLAKLPAMHGLQKRLVVEVPST